MDLPNDKLDIIPIGAKSCSKIKYMFMWFYIVVFISMLFIGFGIMSYKNARKNEAIQNSIVCIKGHLYIIDDGKTVLLEQNDKPIMCK